MYDAITSNAYPESPGCYVKGKIEGKPAVMLIDSGCTNTLVHKKFLNHKKWTGNRITVLTATGERITVPLALLSFESEQGRHEEMVGVTDKLPVDCLLGHSSYGKSLAKQNILDQWEKNVPSDSSGNRSVEDEAFVLTRRQALEIAQQRADDLIDRENELSLKSLAKPDTKSEELKEGDLAALFEDEVALTGKYSVSIHDMPWLWMFACSDIVVGENDHVTGVLDISVVAFVQDTPRSMMSTSFSDVQARISATASTSASASQAGSNVIPVASTSASASQAGSNEIPVASTSASASQAGSNVIPVASTTVIPASSTSA
ncbi:hypothetical protein QZH41_000906 [Actinostola sp. cb2023]|nr:hypothetical protein QZH41_000906 [Actinostola sp. cb2023]